MALDQLRPAYGTELWPVQDAELESLQQDIPKQFYDEVGQGPVDEDLQSHHVEMIVPFFESDGEESIQKEAEVYTPSIAPQDSPP